MILLLTSPDDWLLPCSPARLVLILQRGAAGLTWSPCCLCCRCHQTQAAQQQEAAPPQLLAAAVLRPAAHCCSSTAAFWVCVRITSVAPRSPLPINSTETHPTERHSPARCCKRPQLVFHVELCSGTQLHCICRPEFGDASAICLQLVSKICLQCMRLDCVWIVSLPVTQAHATGAVMAPIHTTSTTQLQQPIHPTSEARAPSLPHLLGVPPTQTDPLVEGHADQAPACSCKLPLLQQRGPQQLQRVDCEVCWPIHL